MDKTFKIFHYLSFVQYPFLVAALYYCYRPIIVGFKEFGVEEMVSNYNLGLLFLGIGLSFASLADVTKKTKIMDKVFGKPKRAKLWIIYICILILVIFSIATFLAFFSPNENLKGLSVGIFVLGVGMLGLLRMNLEIVKTYQKEWE